MRTKEQMRRNIAEDEAQLATWRAATIEPDEDSSSLEDKIVRLQAQVDRQRALLKSA